MYTLNIKDTLEAYANKKKTDRCHFLSGPAVKHSDRTMTGSDLAQVRPLRETGITRVFIKD